MTRQGRGEGADEGPAWCCLTLLALSHALGEVWGGLCCVIISGGLGEVCCRAVKVLDVPAVIERK